MYPGLLLYGLAHAVVDGICAAVLFTLLRTGGINSASAQGLVVLYVILAFSLQPVFGLLLDHWLAYRFSALIGIFLVGLSALAAGISPLAAIVLMGFGNALFHSGGGAISLRLTPGRAAGPGIFVAPGALGLVVGILLGKSGGVSLPWLFIIACLTTFFISLNRLPYLDTKSITQKPKLTNSFILALVCLFFSVVIRSLVGMTVVYPWKSHVPLLLILTLAVVVGKAAGGVMGDRWGWAKVTVIGLLLSAPLIFLGSDFAWLGIFGMLLFNLTMAITVTAVANILPKYPGFSFGLASLALVVGGLPSYFSPSGFLIPGQIFAIILLSVGFVFTGLKLSHQS